MPTRISFAGKGGTGKSTLSALLVNFLLEHEFKPILAVDADPNANLNELLGERVTITLGEIKEELRKSVPDSMARYDYVEMRLHQAIIEANGYDLIVMGQPEGPGCYCAAHSFLAQALEKLLRSYRYLVIDNEAGMEHLSRLNLLEMEHLIIVSDASYRGIITVERIAELLKSLNIKVEQTWMAVNRCPENMPEELKRLAHDIAERQNLNLLAFLPEDPKVLQFEAQRIPVFQWNEAILKKASYFAFQKLIK
ncbi:MAG: AAA family ATPase [Caldimicrobium sp.]|nr:AAA family ATPase [Caldimicrobium sp.]MCX7873166.1 AAA family ATPase [Caldimicrobium sp.]MDW8094255.1 AAA family ATPase [Caldimicrobium sp.]